MTLDEAIIILKDKYKQAEGNPQITDPLSWAIFRTFQIVKKRRKK